jgi:hypothetical protein
VTWDIKTKTIAALVLLFVSFAGFTYFRLRSVASEKTKLLNELAARDKTIEIADGVYQKQTQVIADLKSLLDNSDQQVHSLTEQIEKRDQEIITLNQVAVRWKKAYEGALNAQQEPVDPTVPVPPECRQLRTKVDFDKDFGYIKVTGHTVTNPAEGYVKVEQVRPLRLTMALTRGEDGKWNTFVSSSEDNVAVDVSISAIDLKKLKQKWYERFGIYGNVAGGSGFYSAIGLSVDIGDFTLAPTYGFYADKSASKMYGVSLIWRPFKR